MGGEVVGFAGAEDEISLIEGGVCGLVVGVDLEVADAVFTPGLTTPRWVRVTLPLASTRLDSMRASGAL